MEINLEFGGMVTHMLVVGEEQSKMKDRGDYEK